MHQRARIGQNTEWWFYSLWNLTATTSWDESIVIHPDRFCLNEAFWGIRGEPRVNMEQECNVFYHCALMVNPRQKEKSQDWDHDPGCNAWLPLLWLTSAASAVLSTCSRRLHMLDIGLVAVQNALQAPHSKTQDFFFFTVSNTRVSLCQTSQQFTWKSSCCALDHLVLWHVWSLTLE